MPRYGDDDDEPATPFGVMAREANPNWLWIICSDWPCLRCIAVRWVDLVGRFGSEATINLIQRYGRCSQVTVARQRSILAGVTCRERLAALPR